MSRMNGPKDWSPAEHKKRMARDAQNQAYAELRTILAVLKEKYPQVGLSFGYIGNEETWGDDRSWMFFTQVPIQGTWGLDRMHFGGYTTAELPKFLKDAQEKLEPWIRSQALPRIQKNSGGTMSGPKDWAPGPLPIDDPRVDELFKRIQEAAQAADDAFWAAIVKAFPEVQSGDFPPDASFAWDSATKRAILTWLKYNYPSEFVLQPILDRARAAKAL